MLAVRAEDGIHQVDVIIILALLPIRYRQPAAANLGRIRRVPAVRAEMNFVDMVIDLSRISVDHRDLSVVHYTSETKMLAVRAKNQAGGVETGKSSLLLPIHDRGEIRTHVSRIGHPLAVWAEERCTFAVGVADRRVWSSTLSLITATNWLPCLATNVTRRPSGLISNVSWSHVEGSICAMRVSEAFLSKGGGTAAVGAPVAVGIEVGVSVGVAGTRG